METVVINLIGGPGAGKSTFAHGLMYELKVSGIECEFAAEYAKDVFFEENPKKLDNQIYVFGKQLQRLKRLEGKVDVIVTDAPLLHSIYYDAKNRQTFRNLVLEEYNSFNNLNVLLSRTHSYNPVGRFQDEEGAAAIHDRLKEILEENSIEYLTLESVHKNLTFVKNKIESYIKYANPWIVKHGI